MWTPINHQHLGKDVQDWTPQRLRRCDPYLVWAEATTRLDEPDPKKNKKNKKLPIPLTGVLIELNDPQDFCWLLLYLGWAAGSPDILFVPRAFEGVGTSCFMTGLANAEGLKALVEAVVAGKIQRFTLQESRLDLANRDFELAPLLRAELKKRAELPGSAPTSQQRSGERGESRRCVYMGIVDDGLPFARAEALQSSQREQIALWDQGWEPGYQLGVSCHDADSTARSTSDDEAYWGKPWEVDPVFTLPSEGFPRYLPLRGFLSGRRLTRADPAAAPQRRRPSGDAAYPASRYWTPAPRHTHGAAVLGLMAPWLAAARQAAAWPAHVDGLAMVQLPSRTVADTAGGSLAMQVLDGLRFILWRESKTRPPSDDTDRPVIANVSYGVHAGPHDGSSMVERAMSELLHDHPKLHLVLPAGNAHRAGCHARCWLGHAGGEDQEDSITLRVLPDNPLDTFVELWLPRSAEIALKIQPPGMAQEYEIRRGQAWVHRVADAADPAAFQSIEFGAIYAGEVAQSLHETMVLLVIGPTRRMVYNPAQAPRGQNQQLRRPVQGVTGQWTLRLRNLKKAAVTVRARVERGDAPPDRAGGSRQAFFPDSCDEAFGSSNAAPEDTLNGIATLRHPRMHVVGAMRTDGKLSDYSAADGEHPPTAKPLPTVVVPADWSRSLPGLRTMGFVGNAVTRLNGTSAACAVYTRALALALSNDPGQLPDAPAPAAVPPEIDCGPERQPQADDDLRGQEQRKQFPYEPEGVVPWKAFGQWK